MRLIRGVLLEDPAASVEPSWLSPIADQVAQVGEPAAVGGGRVRFSSSMGTNTVESSDAVLAVGDLDMVKLADLDAYRHDVRARGGPLTSLYAAAGLDLVQRIRGAFAFGIWDRHVQRLILGVDRFGIRRLYYARIPGGLAFASRPSALLSLPGLSGEIDPEAVYCYLNFGFVPAPWSIFRGIRRLPPGHLLLWERGEPRVSRYWDLAYPEHRVPLRQAAAEAFDRVREAVRVSLEGAAIKETGAFLSGGTDSSTVVGLMARISGERVNAFSIGFEEGRYDELGYAELAARHFDAAHHTRTLTGDEALEMLPDLVRAYDEPLGNDSTVATYACARLASEAGMARLLAGDGGDELFGGNERYRMHQIFAVYGRIPRALRSGLIEPFLGIFPEDGVPVVSRAKRYVRRAGLPNPRRFYSYGFFVAQQASALLDPGFSRAIDPELPWWLLQAHFDHAAAPSELNRLLYVDLKLTIGDNDLYKVTRTAELAGIDVRFPMLDHPLAEFTGGLPASYKVRRLEKRYLFKRAFRDLLPQETLAKPKHGFGVPVADWLRTHAGFRELARDSLLSTNACVKRYLRRESLEQLCTLHEADRTPYYGSLLWVLLMLELWHRQHGQRGRQQ